MCKWVRFDSKKASNAVSNCHICKCSFSTKIGTGKLGRISTENHSQTSNREGSRATILALMCASLSPLLKINFSLIRSCVQFLLAAESTKFISVISFGKELYKRIERSESRSFRFKRPLPSSVSLSQRSLANRRVFLIGLHATASKSLPRKALLSSVQEQSQHQPKDNFLEEHITYQVCL
jgi:hypothetical protein